MRRARLGVGAMKESWDFLFRIGLCLRAGDAPQGPARPAPKGLPFGIRNAPRRNYKCPSPREPATRQPHVRNHGQLHMISSADIPPGVARRGHCCGASPPPGEVAPQAVGEGKGSRNLPFLVPLRGTLARLRPNPADLNDAPGKFGRGCGRKT